MTRWGQCCSIILTGCFSSTHHISECHGCVDKYTPPQRLQWATCFVICCRQNAGLTWLKNALGQSATLWLQHYVPDPALGYHNQRSAPVWSCGCQIRWHSVCLWEHSSWAGITGVWSQLNLDVNFNNSFAKPLKDTNLFRSTFTWPCLVLSSTW